MLSIKKAAKIAGLPYLIASIPGDSCILYESALIGGIERF
jgi:hypothetical protein